LTSCGGAAHDAKKHQELHASAHASAALLRRVQRAQAGVARAIRAQRSGSGGCVGATMPQKSSAARLQVLADVLGVRQA
jgi:hypothetical protein